MGKSYLVMPILAMRTVAAASRQAMKMHIYHIFMRKIGIDVLGLYAVIAQRDMCSCSIVAGGWMPVLVRIVDGSVETGVWVNVNNCLRSQIITFN